MNKQPFYHRMDVMFTATEDLTFSMNRAKFLKELATFLQTRLSRKVLKNTVQFDGIPDAEPGDPHDLVGE